MVFGSQSKTSSNCAKCGSHSYGLSYQHLPLAVASNLQLLTLQ